TGHADAFERLMRRHNALVFRTARSVVRSDAAAEDCAQQAWILAYDRLHQLTDRAGFAPWVARISYREALRMARFDRSRGNVSLDAIDGEHESSSMAAPLSTPEYEAQRTELRSRLETSIDQLPAALREPFVLCEVHQLSARETGDLLGITEQNVRVRAHRARAALRDKLGELMQPELAFSFDGSRCDRMVEWVMRVVRSRG
ncbi:MAG: sigma-70 family RNA polymerase sigma factor, partial [Proteobacteria bacterium]